MAVLALALLVSTAQAVEPFAGARYELGRGLSLPALGLDVRGYTTALYEDQEGERARGEWHDFSLMLAWQAAPAWQAFAELEAEGVLTADSRDVGVRDLELQVERLYVDHTLQPSTTVRLGQFLTPFGRWNEVHADPLVWTVTRPLSTVIAIPDHAIGAMVYGTVPLARDSIEYKAWVDDSIALDPRGSGFEFEDYELPGLGNAMRRALGLQFRYHRSDGRVQLGLSYAALELRDGEGHHQAVGLDGLYVWRRTELSGEVLYRANFAQPGSDDWGGFVQIAVPLLGQVYGIGRGEYYRSGPLDTDAHRFTGGLAYRPHPALTFKCEYHDGSERGLLPDGVELSVSVLF